jgi:tRNA G18 (ribose-2'-O)-methylase SpoU
MTVVADDIENPGNAETLLTASEMFGAVCVFREHAHLARSELNGMLNEHGVQIVTTEEISARFRPVLALDNVPNAAEIYGYRPPAGHAPALVVGNERRGVSHELLALSDCAVQIPMLSKNLNCLNVAAAAAVGLYYLMGNGGGGLRRSAHPEKLRPMLFFLAPTDHVELGSSIRSAGALGWQQLLVDDRHNVWFGSRRSARAEGRAAARRARNPIRVIPSSFEHRYAFDEVCVVTPEPGSTPLSQAKLAGGQRQLLIIPDTQGIDLGTVDWQRFGRQITFVTLDVPHRPAVRQYRLDATIALAEAARQIGRPPTGVAKQRPSPAPRYDRVLRPRVPDLGEIVYLEELERY